MNSLRIDSSRIYLLIFRSQRDSYSYSSQFHFVNISPIRKYCILANIIRIHEYLANIIRIHEYLSKYSWISYFKIEYIKRNAYNSLWLCLLGKFFKLKYIRIKKKKLLEKMRDIIFFWYLWIVCEYFPPDYNYSYSFLKALELTNYSYSYLYITWQHKSIPIPICGKKKNYFPITALYAAKQFISTILEWIKNICNI